MRQGVSKVSRSDSQCRRDRFSYAVQRSGGVSVVCARGDLDGEAHSLLYDVIAGELAREPAQLVLELSGATSVDEATVETLAGASALAAESDTSFCLVTPPTGPIMTALAVAAMIERFEIFETVDEAKRHR